MLGLWSNDLAVPSFDLQKSAWQKVFLGAIVSNFGLIGVHAGFRIARLR